MPEQKKVEELPPGVRDQATAYARESGVAQQAAATQKDVSIADTNRPEVLRTQEAQREQEQAQKQAEQQPEPPKPEH